jgi:hypothetical protein
LKNKSFAIIFDYALKGKNLNEIHKKLKQEIINDKKMLVFMKVVAKKAKKIVNPKKDNDFNIPLLMVWFNKNDYDGKIKRIINEEATKTSENSKNEAIDNFIKNNRLKGKWIYLASSHNDCAEDHKPYQGKLYYDNKASKDVISYCESKGMRSIQWVMDKPVYFITRPNCRHFFIGLNISEIEKNSLKYLKNKYHTHSSEGDRSFKTPRKIAIEEYEDRLQRLKMFYNKQPSEYLRNLILKTEMLIRKWKKTI